MERQELLEKIAPYLPYGLNMSVKGEYLNESNDSQKLMTFKLVGLGDFVEYHEIGRSVNEDCTYEDCLLHLRPLSDLTKEMDNSELTYYDELKNLFGDFELQHNAKCFYPYTDDWISFIDIVNFNNKLFKWHFDVFGLIEDGYAIDINTL